RKVGTETGRGAPAAADTSRAAVQAGAPAGGQGPGGLFPALVVGVGQMGLSVLQKSRQALHHRVGSPDALPNIRLLAIDTDPDTMTAAARGPKGAALAAREMLLVRLNRPSHFLKPRDGTIPYNTYLDPQMLYRIPRTQLTAGLRCLGRLALMDNYRDIADRIHSELGACTEPTALATAEEQNRLGLRTNRPRVYVVAGL